MNKRESDAKFLQRVADDYRRENPWDRRPIVCLPMMTKPARDVEKGTKFLPEMWKPNG